MKTFFKTSLLILILAAITSCKKSCTNNSGMSCNDAGTTLIFGRFCGECITNCATMYRLNDGCLQVDATHNYITSTGINFKGTNMTAAQFNSVKGLNNKIPQQLLSSTMSVFGSPDSHDQCGYYLETKINGVKQIWLVDTDTMFQPDYLKPFIIEVNHAISLLH
ncbi:MAG: hypothetical protein ABI723_07080 [Bacteroidia bacterium]